MAVPAVGKKAPAFALPDETGRTVRLSSLAGMWVVIFFYPKANTAGCTTEACGFRDAFAALAAQGAHLVGISPDAAPQLAKFKARHTLPFPLLSDSTHSAAGAYGVWVEKSLYGRKYMGVERSTFIIGADGRLEAEFRKVKPAGHAAEVLAWLIAH